MVLAQALGAIDAVVFLVIALVSTGLLLVSAAMGGIMEFGHDLHLDFGHHDVGGSTVEGEAAHFSVQSVLAFFVGFGSAGWSAMAYGGMTAFPAAGVGIVAGLGLGVLAWLLIRTLLRQASYASYTMSDLVGTQASVVLDIPAGGVGRVQLVHDGSMLTLPARAAGAIASGSVVTVLSALAGQECTVALSDTGK